MYEYIKSLLKFDVLNKGKTNLIQNFSQILASGTYQEFELLCKDEKIAKIIIDNDLFWKNINLIVEKAKQGGNILDSVRYLYKYDKNYILNQKEKLFDSYKEIALEYFLFLKECGVDLKLVVDYLAKNNIEVPYNHLAQHLLTVPIGKSILISNIDYFVFSNNRLLELKSLLVKNNINVNIDEEINKNNDIVVEELVYNRTGLTVKDLEKENLLFSLKKIISSILGSEGKNYSDIEKLGEVNFSDVYKIGNKILKISKERKKFSLDRSKNNLFLQPLFQADIKSGIDKKQLLHIETTDVVDTQNVSYENLYQIFKEIRNLGYVWIDCRLTNIGRLLKDTKVTIKDNKNSEIVEVLRKGTIVILDDDYIYTPDEFKNIDIRKNERLRNIYNYNLFQNFEIRYQNEQMQKNK